MQNAAKDVHAAKVALGTNWIIGKMLGEGAFGTVIIVQRKSDKQEAAAKIIAIPRDIKERQAIAKETHMMKSMDHPYIVKCFESVSTPTHAFLILELMSASLALDPSTSGLPSLPAGWSAAG
jgi:serine/threonine protein kinase